MQLSKKTNKVFFCIFLAFFCCLFSNRADAQTYRIGVFYYPGWKEGDEVFYKKPWDAIKNYPEREPLLGWYKDGDLSVANQHLQWMHEFGIDYVIYDWYWRNDNKVRLNHAIDAYLSLKNRHGVNFAIMWANHTTAPENYDQFDVMVNYWFLNLMVDGDYLKKDGKPIVFIFSPDTLEKNANRFGATSRILLDRARNAAVRAGLPGLYIVGSTQARKDALNQVVFSGYDAISAYNYHRGYSGSFDKRGNSRNYQELVDGYKESWEWLLKNSPIPYFIPVTSGWDKRPWQMAGVTDPHDGSAGDAYNFEIHLNDAFGFAEKFKDNISGDIVVCCWNEFGEGSYVEPTKKEGFGFLQAIRETKRKNSFVSILP